jgi:hypothetical protein
MSWRYSYAISIHFIDSLAARVTTWHEFHVDGQILSPFLDIHETVYLITDTTHTSNLTLKP